MDKPRKRRSSTSRRRKAPSVKRQAKPKCRIVVIGVGGAGNSVLSKLVESGITNVECVAVNTDLKDLNAVDAARRVLIGEKLTCGLSTGGEPEIGKAAAQESRLLIEDLVADADVVFITAALAGGTGTGAAPVLADIARRKGAVVVGVVTTPLRIGKHQNHRIEHSIQALDELRIACDTVVVVDSNKFLQSTSHLPVDAVFSVVDQALANMIKSVSETISSPSLVNFDFCDFKNVVREGGVAVVGMGESDAPNRAEEAARNALQTPLLDVDFAEAKGALVQVCGGPNMTVEEVNRAGEIVADRMGRRAKVVQGARSNPVGEGLQVTVVMTGVKSPRLSSWLGNMMPELYDIESSFSESEKPLHIDLPLEQIENFED